MADSVAGDIIQGVANLGAAGIDAWSTNKANEFSWEKQKKVLQNQVQWRVADTVAAGLHPLAALGLNPASGPTALASNAGDFISRMGANIGSAVDRALPDEDKLLARAMMRQQMSNNELQNAHLRAQTALLNQQLVRSGRPPDLPGKENKGGGASVVGRIGWSDDAIPLPPGMTAEDFENLFGEGAGEFTGASSLAESLQRQQSNDPFKNRGGGWEGMMSDLARLKAWLDSWQVGL